MDYACSNTSKYTKVLRSRLDPTWDRLFLVVVEATPSAAWNKRSKNVCTVTAHHKASHGAALRLGLIETWGSGDMTPVDRVVRQWFEWSFVNHRPFSSFRQLRSVFYFFHLIIAHARSTTEYDFKNVTHNWKTLRFKILWQAKNHPKKKRNIVSGVY